MRIGNWLGSSVIVALAAIHGMAAAARTAEQVKNVPTAVPLGGSLDSQSGDQYFGVYVPTRFGGELHVKTTDGKIVDLKRPNGSPFVDSQDIGFDHQGWYTFKVEGTRSHTRSRTPSFRSRRAPRSPGTSITGPPRLTRSTSPGPAATRESTR